MKTMTKIFPLVAVILFIASCGKKQDSLSTSDLGITSGAISVFTYNESTSQCEDSEGNLGYNNTVGECADLTNLYPEEITEAVSQETDLTGSLGEGVDFTNSTVDFEYVLVNKLKVDETTTMHDGTAWNADDMETEKNNLCAKWLAKKNKKTGEYPSGIAKKIIRLGCSE